MAQVTSGKITRCGWLLTWRDFSVMTAGIMKIVNVLWTKTNSNLTLEQETAERKASRRGRHFDKVEASGDTGVKS